MTKRITILLCLLACLSSCKTITSFIHDDQVVARVGEEKLFKSQLDAYIPVGVAPEDSIKLATQYINTWATDVLYARKAEQKLSKEELDVTPELEDYRRSLLKYRYEQRYINERLDTLVTDDQIREYYENHQDSFILERPILKVRFVDILKESPDRAKLLKLMASSKPEDANAASELAFSAALKYFDSSEEWMDAVMLAREFGTDYGTMLSFLKDSYITMEPEGRGDVLSAYVVEIRKSGVAPVEFCRNRVKEMILSLRKYELMSTLEQDLLDEARSQNNIVIY